MVRHLGFSPRFLEVALVAENGLYVVITSVMLTLVVCKILFPKEIFDVKFTMCHSISNPEESHFQGPGTLPFHGVVGDTNCG